MERIDFTASMVRTLKGAPISCLMLMAMIGQPVSAQYLERNSGYSDKSVGAALLLLQDYGLITRNERYVWRIAINVRQLPLMVLSDEEMDQTDLQVECEVEAAPNEIQGNLDKNGGTRKFSDSENFRVHSSSRSIDLTTKELTELPLLGAADPENFRVAENLEACDRFGIREPKRSTISKLKFVNPRMISFHCSTVKDIALAIWRIEHEYRVKPDWIDPLERNVCAQTFTPEPMGLPAEAVEAWQTCLEKVRSAFRKVDFDTWLSSADLVNVDAEGWTIRAGNRLSGTWIKDHATAAIQEAAGVSIKVEW